MSEQFFDARKLRRSPKIRARVVRWIAALKSGEYKRATARLRKVTSKGERFCCLGVACDLESPHGWEGENGGHKLFGADNNLLTVEFSEKLGLYGGRSDGSGQRLLANLNDSKNGNFKKIAHKLERAYREALA